MRVWRAWVLALIIQVVVVWIEYVSSRLSHSRALISDILHNSADILLVIMTALPLCIRLGSAMTKGAKNFSVTVNVLFLMSSGVAGIALGLSALGNPDIVVYSLAWPAALVSLVGNLLIYGVVRPFRHDHGAQIFGWHQLWDVGTAMAATISLLLGSYFRTPYFDAQASIFIGTAMCLHWPIVKLFDRNGHNHSQ